MSQIGSRQKLNLNKNKFIDRGIEENVKFPQLTIRLDTIDSVLLLLECQDEEVLINTLKHIVEYARRNNENISLLKEKNLLQLLLQKEFYRNHSSIILKRLSLYLASFCVENINLVDLESFKICEIVNLSLTYYMEEEDDYCCEYLSVVLNKCSEDPQIIDVILKDPSFVLKYFSTIATSTNPDILLHSLELLYKILWVQSGEEKHKFITLASFPLKRVLCELNCEFFEIRKAALKVIQSLVLDRSGQNILNQTTWATFLVEQLTKMFSESLLTEEMSLLVEVLAASMDQDVMISLFFDLNLFDNYLNRINADSMGTKMICEALRVFTECAKCAKYLVRLVSADVTEKLLECLFNDDHKPADHILLGLNRLMKSPRASKRIIDSYDQGLLNKILNILPGTATNIKTREEAANLLENLLSYAFHKTAGVILSSGLATILANIFAQAPDERSIDLLLNLLNVIEMLAANSDYRVALSANKLMIKNLGILLKNSYASGIMVTHLLRCLCSLVNEEEIHDELLDCFLCSSIKRALQSASNQVKTAATNFIMQTTRFTKLMTAYKKSGVLEVLLLNQKQGFCVPTWQPAIESILNKNLTMKFCIRNRLTFTDITVGIDFMVSKRKFDDFRVFQCILKEDVSPLHPVIVVNFNRPKDPENLVVKVPSCFNTLKSDFSDQEWCYCRSPGDEFLPKYLEEVNSQLKYQNLAVNPVKIQKGIDFDNIAKRAKVVAQVVERALGNDLKLLDLSTAVECCNEIVDAHLKKLCIELHCSFIPLGRIRSGCKFERAILFKALADQIGLPCTLQRSVDGRTLFNELPMLVEVEPEAHCEKKTLSIIPWRMLRATHIVDLMDNAGELYPLQSRQALQYLNLL